MLGRGASKYLTINTVHDVLYISPHRLQGRSMRNIRVSMFSSVPIDFTVPQVVNGGVYLTHRTYAPITTTASHLLSLFTFPVRVTKHTLQRQPSIFSLRAPCSLHHPPQGGN
jgi:hypothetical protein